MTEVVAQGSVPSGDGDPEFSLVVATLNNQEELPGFIESVGAQSVGPDAVEVLFVDLGSTDGTAALLEAAEERLPFRVTLLGSESLAAARNAGLARSSGRWISFPEPGAILPADYLSTVSAFVRRQQAATMIATASPSVDPDTGKTNNDHPLRVRFAGGDQLVDLDRFPEYFHRDPATVFLRTSLCDEFGLSFSESPFAGGELLVQYLLRCERRLVGFLASARYLRRPRSVDHVSDDATPAVAPLHGWRDLLQDCLDGTDAHVPEWVQRAALDTLAECFSDDARARGGRTRLDYPGVTALREALDEVVTHLDAHVIRSYRLRGLSSERRDLLLHGLSGENWHTPYVVATKYDLQQQQVRVSYRFTGAPPDERVLVRGNTVEPSGAKVRSCEYFGYPMIYERILWLPASGMLRVVLNGEPVEIRRKWDSVKSTTTRPSQIADWFVQDARERPRRRWTGWSPRPALVRAAASSRPAHRRYADSWVLMDRLHEADDNGERLFEYLRDNRRDINAWFVIERGTADWQRLRRSRYRRRVVAYGSWRWKLLMLNCSDLASSHVHESIRRPAAVSEIATPGWRFTFLQHGVIKDDISRWLNKLDVDLFVASTPGEFDSLTGDRTPYAYTTKEVKLTGLPRFDRLRRTAGETATKRYILVCPTWRDWLCKPMVPGTQVRPLVDNFLDSEYVRSWLRYLNDDRLLAHARGQRLVIGFMPHPNFQPAVKDVEFPPGVEVLTYAEHDVQKLIAESALMVTDYSSIAFNAAYIDQAVVYLQFDAARMNSGEHNYRPGYFDYRDDGFGPLVETVEDAVSATIALTAPGSSELDEVYRERIDRAFPDRSGGCCARVTAAMETAAGRARRPARRSRAGRRFDAARTWLAHHPRLARAVRAGRRRLSLA